MLKPVFRAESFKAHLRNVKKFLKPARLYIWWLANIAQWKPEAERFNATFFSVNSVLSNLNSTAFASRH